MGCNASLEHWDYSVMVEVWAKDLERHLENEECAYTYNRTIFLRKQCGNFLCLKWSNDVGIDRYSLKCIVCFR